MDRLKIIFSTSLMNTEIYKKFTLKKAMVFDKKYPHGIMGVSIETTLNCNAKCIMCYHAYKKLYGTMNMNLFKKIIDDCFQNGINYITLSIYGEPLMDKDFFERIKYLRKYNMNYSFSTNGSLLTNENAMKLFKLGGLKEIIFSVAGYDKNVYEKIMINLNRDVVYKNILNFLSLKKKFNKTDIYTMISIVKTKFNKNDIKKFVNFWQKQKGVNRVRISDLWDRVGDKNISQIGELTKLHKKGNWLSPCKQLWGKVYIYFDGRVGPCCDDADLRQLVIGDMNKQTLREIYAGEKIMNLRKLHIKDKRKDHAI